MYISIDTHNYIPSHQISQENYSYSQNIPLPSKFLEENYILPSKGKKYRNAEMQFIDIVILLCPTKGSSVQLSSSQISGLIKKERSAANEGRRRAINNGAVNVVRKQLGPKLWASNIYSLPDEWYDEQVRQRMRIVFPNLDDSIAQPKRDRINYRSGNRQVMRENLRVQKARRMSELDNFESHEICPEDIDIPSDSSREAVAKILFTENENLSPKKEQDLQKTDILLKGNIYIQKNNINFNKIISKNNITKLLINKLSKNINNNNSLKGKPMQDLYSTDIISYWRQLKSIRPTLWGQLYLSAFPEEIVLHADKVTLNCKKNLATNLDRWKYLLSVCKGYSKDNEIEPDWLGVFNEAKNMNMPQNAVFFDDTFTQVKEVVPQKTSRSKSNINPYLHNLELIREYGPHLESELNKKQTHEEEWEQVRNDQPQRYEARVKTAQQFRQMMGLTEDGEFLPGRSPHEAMKILFDNLM